MAPGCLHRYEEGPQSQNFGEVTDGKIAAFLEKAGLSEKPPERGGDCMRHVYADLSAEERRRYVYAEVICNAIEEVESKHESALGVGLGMHAEAIYSHLGVDY